MISYLTRDTLNIEKYNHCIANAVNSRVYAYSWYLDIAADAQWDTLVLNDYEAVMPLPKRRKYFINYVYTPFWVLQLGIFYKPEVEKESTNKEFIKRLRRLFFHINLRLNTANAIDKNASLRYKHELDLSQSYAHIQIAYRSDRKKDLKKAHKHKLQLEETRDSMPLLNLYRANVGQRVSDIKERDYQRLNLLIQECIKRDHGEIMHVFDVKGALAAACFLAINNNRITILISSTDFTNRSNGANTFLIDSILRKYSSSNVVFDFGGSSITTIGAYFESFGATKKRYYHYKKNTLS